MLLCFLELILVAKGHLEELQKAEMFSKSKLLPVVFIKTHYWINQRQYILLQRWSLQTGFIVYDSY